WFAKFVSTRQESPWSSLRRRGSAEVLMVPGAPTPTSPPGATARIGLCAITVIGAGCPQRVGAVVDHRDEPANASRPRSRPWTMFTTQHVVVDGSSTGCQCEPPCEIQMATRPLDALPHATHQPRKRVTPLIQGRPVPVGDESKLFGPRATACQVCPWSSD